MKKAWMELRKEIFDGCRQKTWTNKNIAHQKIIYDR